jgi:hypothetical protein
MGLGDRVWETFKTVIQMRDKIGALAEVTKSQQLRIENLTERVIRLETTLDLLMKTARPRQIDRR